MTARARAGAQWPSRVKSFVRCCECGTEDTPRWIKNDIDPNDPTFEMGTATRMRCPDCGDPLAARCRSCCITGHGTRPEPEVPA